MRRPAFKSLHFSASSTKYSQCPASWDARFCPARGRASTKRYTIEHLIEQYPNSEVPRNSHSAWEQHGARDEVLIRSSARLCPHCGSLRGFSCSFAVGHYLPSYIMQRGESAWTLHSLLGMESSVIWAGANPGVQNVCFSKSNYKKEIEKKM